MGQKTDQIERHIEEQRVELHDNIKELRRKVKDTFDWRAQFEHHPMAMVGAAVGGGLLLSALIGRPRSGRAQEEPWHSDSASPTEHKSRDFAHVKKPESKSWRNIKTALTAVAAERVGDMLDSVLPGFGREYNKVKSGNGAFSPNAER